MNFLLLLLFFFFAQKIHKILNLDLAMREEGEYCGPGLLKRKPRFVFLFKENFQAVCFVY